MYGTGVYGPTACSWGVFEDGCWVTSLEPEALSVEVIAVCRHYDTSLDMENISRDRRLPTASVPNTLSVFCAKSLTQTLNEAVHRK